MRENVQGFDEKTVVVAGWPMNCREFTDFLHEYLFGDLPAEERAEFENHLAECSGCVAYLDGYRKTIALEKAAFADPENLRSRADVPEELLQAILRARSQTA
jgi:anti-sigma factor RsiW